MRKDVQNEISKYYGEEVMLLNKSELSRRFDCNRRTVDRYISNEYSLKKRKKRDYSSVLDDYKSIVISKVDTYGATAMAVYKFIQKKGYSGKYGIVANFVRGHKNQETKKATIRFETTPGLQAQIDWKEQVKMVSRSGQVLTIQIFLMVMGYSRKKFLKVTTDKTQKTLFMCLFEAFKYFKGVPSELLFDNMATVVDRDKSSFKSVKLNDTFKHFSDDAGFLPITCRPYRPKTKGKVEAVAKLVDRLKVYNEEFDTFEDLENITRDLMTQVNEEICSSTGLVPNKRFEEEQEYLRPLPPMQVLLSYFSYHKEYKVSNESMVNYKGRKYSVPTKYIGEYLNILEDTDTIQIYYSEDLVACHQKSEKFLNYIHSHVKEILKSDALKDYTDNELDAFIEKNLSNMDVLLDP